MLLWCWWGNYKVAFAPSTFLCQFSWFSQDLDCILWPVSSVVGHSAANRPFLSGFFNSNGLFLLSSRRCLWKTCYNPLVSLLSSWVMHWNPWQRRTGSWARVRVSTRGFAKSWQWGVGRRWAHFVGRAHREGLWAPELQLFPWSISLPSPAVETVPR